MSLTWLSNMGDFTGSDEMVCLTGTGDETRAWGPPFVTSESVYFLSVNRNKKVKRLSYTSHLSYNSYLSYASEHTWGPFQKEGFKTLFEPEHRVAKICNVSLRVFDIKA